MAKTSTKAPLDIAKLVQDINAEQDMAKLEALMKRAQAMTGTGAEQAAKRAKGRLAALRAVAARKGATNGSGSIQADGQKWRALLAFLATSPTPSAISAYVKDKAGISLTPKLDKAKAQAPAKATKVPDRRPGDEPKPRAKRREVQAAQAEAQGPAAPEAPAQQPGA